MIDNRYVQLEYLESSGTQYIDTGFKPNNNTHIKVDVYSTNTTNNIVNLGCWNSAYNNGAFSLTNGANNGASIYAGYDGQGGNLINGRITTFPATFELDKNVVKVNDTTRYTFTTSTFSVNYNLTLFATNRAGTITWAQDGTTSKYAISSCKIWDNDTLVRDLVPAKRKSDNVLGMFDKVNNVFYTNAGTGSFVGGKEINDAFKSRRIPFAYSELTHIESTGTQYIDTGLKGNLNTAVEIKFEGITPSTNDILNIFGDITTSTSALSCNTGFNNTTAKPTSRFGNKDTGAVIQNLSKNTPYIITSNKNTYTIKNQDGTVYRSYSLGTTTAFTTTNNLWAFICNNNNAPSTYTGGSKFYYCKIWDNDVLVRNFIPVVRKIDNVAGMYDLVEGKFYTNAGTGAFIAGDIVKTADKIKIKKKTYQLLDYIQSTGKEYIDTGVYPTQLTEVEYRCAVTGSISNVDSHLFGSRLSASSEAFDLAYMNTSANGIEKFHFIHGTTTTQETTTSVTASQLASPNTYYMSGTSFKVDGSEKMSFSTSSFTGSYSLWLFGVNSTGSLHNQVRAQRVYKCKIWDNNVLVRDYIPARRLSDNEVGMLDMVEGKFYGNVSGQGAFIGSDNRYANYEFYDYIEGTGTQYIDTGIAPNGTNTGFDIVYSYTAPRNYETAIGVLTKAGVGYFGLATSTTQVYRYWGNGDAKTTSVVADKKYHVTENYMNDKKFIWDDGVLTWDLSDSTTIATGNIWLFNFNPGSYTGKQPLYGRIYSCKISEGTTLVRNFLPAKRLSDNAVGMLDIANNVFYANQGTGVFTTGNKVPAPDEYYESKEVQELRLPYNGNKYKFFDYIESSGTQWLDSGVKTGANIKLDYEYEATAYNGSTFCVPMAARVSATSNSISHGFNSNSTYFGFGNNSEFALSPYFTLNTRYHIVQDKTAVYVNDVKKTYPRTQTTAFTTPLNLYLFARNNTNAVGNYFLGKIYYAKIYDDDVLVRDFIPAQRLSDNAIGMFDLVNNVFYTNKGTGSFTTSTNTMPNKVMMPFWKRYPDIPSQYEVKEYLQSDGNQYIDTGWQPTSKVLAVEFKVNCVSSMATTSICGSESSSFSGARWLFTLYGQKNNWQQYPLIGTWNNGSGSGYYISTPQNTDVVARIDYNDGTTTCTSTQGDNWTHTQSGDNITNHKQNLRLFQNTDTQRSSIKMYSYKIWDNNVLVRDFVPVLRKSDNILGLYDIVTDKFLENAGTGSFTAG